MVSVIGTSTIVAVVLAGAGAGALGSMLGIGGGVFLVPFLVAALHLPIQQAVGISLVSVIATSSAVAARTAGRQLINLRLGMLLEVSTAIGGAIGGFVAAALSATAIAWLFSGVTVAIALSTLARMNRRNVLPHSTDPGRWGGRFLDGDTGAMVSYRVKRMPVALGGSFAAGVLSSLLGIGGGTVKVPVLNAWCGVPMRAATATSAFMIGVTATSGAVVYFAHGLIVPTLAAAAVLGVQAGTAAGHVFGTVLPVRLLKLLMAIVLFAVAAVMFLEAR